MRGRTKKNEAVGSSAYYLSPGFAVIRGADIQNEHIAVEVQRLAEDSFSWQPIQIQVDVCNWLP